MVDLPSQVGSTGKLPRVRKINAAPPMSKNSLSKTNNTNHNGMVKSGDCTNAKVKNTDKIKNLSAIASRHAPKKVFIFHARAIIPSKISDKTAITKSQNATPHWFLIIEKTTKGANTNLNNVKRVGMVNSNELTDNFLNNLVCNITIYSYF